MFHWRYQGHLATITKSFHLVGISSFISRPSSMLSVPSPAQLRVLLVRYVPQNKQADLAEELARLDDASKDNYSIPTLVKLKRHNTA
jgi:hypothetical protein